MQEGNHKEKKSGKAADGGASASRPRRVGVPFAQAALPLLFKFTRKPA